MDDLYDVTPGGLVRSDGAETHVDVVE